jgi:Na+-translocating ferredoxin:NAD+ oxidoreductase RnfG subunit
MQIHWLLPLGLGAASVAQIAHATQYMTVEQAQRAAFPEATAFVATPAAVDATAFAAPAGWSPRIWQARNGDKLLGWLFEDAVIGKSELITYALAVDAAGAVISVEVLDYRESHGSEIRLAPWRKQFVGRTVHDLPEFNRDIKNISGATLSCRHLTEGVQRLLKVHARVLAPTARG